jgi:hypothetical protein
LLYARPESENQFKIPTKKTEDFADILNSEDGIKALLAKMKASREFEMPES